MAQALRPLRPELSPRHRFGAELRRWRQLRGLSQAALARVAYVSPALVGKVEKAERWPTTGAVDEWEAVLDSGGALPRLWSEVEAYRQGQFAEASPIDPGHWMRALHVLAAVAAAGRTRPGTGFRPERRDDGRK